VVDIEDNEIGEEGAPSGVLTVQGAARRTQMVMRTTMTRVASSAEV
jgi:hypothetical protein